VVRGARGAQGRFGIAAAQVADHPVLQAAEVGGPQTEEKDGAIEDDRGSEHRAKKQRPHDDAAAQKDVVERKILHGRGCEDGGARPRHQEVIATVSQIGVENVSQSH
jgi:hypothetical protein